ncbi:TM2 domain-containing protein [Idiomarina sp.]|uniref:TM2 domain-containing protein n=1 Tax=Idiomarina sp. TaxID=1874361 RepID=UPI0025C1A46E|nr:TM2 domain-containing protein [Idiomarina sp.]
MTLPTMQELSDREEHLREQIRQLSDEQRKHYYRLERQQLKDPDTYAVLNYFFIAGLHHFYLGRTNRGLINIALMVVGLLLLPLFAPLGVILLITVFIVELPQLFKSQRIVYAHNLDLMDDILETVRG